MKQYLIWNLKQQAWRMSEFVGFTDDVEFAGIYSEEYILKNTGINDVRTGDYACNLLIDAYTLDIEDFKERMIKLSAHDKNALKKAIMQERKRRGLPIEYIIKDNEKYCPYCKNKITKQIAKIMGWKCPKCYRVYIENKEW